MTGGQRLRHELRLALVALQFLTRCPVPAWAIPDQGFDPRWLNGCVRYFPLVGAGIGTCGAMLLWVAAFWWPPLVAALLAVAGTVWITGAFHEDGLADTFDALGGPASRERALAIMKDSRIGTYGAVALVLSLGLRVVLVAAMVQTDAWRAGLALVGAHVMGRAAPVVLMAWLPYGGDPDHAKAKSFTTAVPCISAALASGSALLLVFALALLGTRLGALDAAWLLRWPVAVLACAIVTALMRRWLLARLGGYTGDTLGATEQLCELMVLLSLAAG